MIIVIQMNINPMRMMEKNVMILFLVIKVILFFCICFVFLTKQQ